MRKKLVVLLLFASPAFARSIVDTPQPPSLRLPDGARPTRYTAELTLIPTEPTFHGVIEIELDVKQPLPILWLNANELTVEKAAARIAKDSIAAKVIPTAKDYVGFQFAKPLPPGKVILDLEYTGKLADKESSGVTRQKEHGEPYIFTHFEPIDARRAFPCFDEPSYKTPWRLSIKVRKSDRAFANGAEVKREPDGALERVTFAETKPLPSYLVAFAVGPFEVVDAGKSRKSGTPVRIITPKGEAAQARWAKESTAEVLSRLEEWFGIDYAFGKLDSIAVPFFPGAMENPGLVTYASSLILRKPEDETINSRRAYASVATHELAHQWFGDLVTTEWWDDLWLNEAFATWMTPKIIERWQPGWGAPEGRVRSRATAMGADSLVSARRIRQPIVSDDDMQNAFDRITYDKGASVLHMFDSLIGPDTFQKGVRKYLAEHAYGNATAKQFLAAISAAAGHDVAPAFSTFLDQAGAPMVSFATTCEGGKAKVALTQQRYLPIGSPLGATPEMAKQLWQVPICVRWQKGGESGRVCTTLADKRGELALPVCPDKLEPNDGGAGYFRAQLDGKALAALLGDGGKGLTVPEKLSLISDANAMVSAGKMPFSDKLAVIAKLAGDPNRHVVQASIDAFAWVRDGELLPAAERPQFVKFVREHYGARAQALGWLPKKGEDEDARLLRHAVVSLVANEGEDPALIAEAKKLTAARLAGDKSVDTEMADDLYGAAAQAGDRALYDSLAKAARAEKDLVERRRLLNALGRFRDPAIARDALALTLTDGLDVRESFNIVWGATRWPETRALAWDFVKRNFDALIARLPRDSGAHLPWVATSQCTDAARADADAFFRPRAARFTGGPRQLEQALEELRLCTAFKKAQGPSVASFFSR
jgi:alanyl aminopeptidase